MSRRGAIPAAVAAVVALAAVVGFLVARSAAEPDSQPARAVANATAANADTNLDAQGRLLTAAAQAIGYDVDKQPQAIAGEVALVLPTNAQLAVVRPIAGGGFGVYSAGPRQIPQDVLDAVTGERLLFDLAVDDGGAKTSTAVDLGRPSVMTVQAVYGGPVPADVTARRSSARGFLVSVEAMADVTGLEPSSWANGDLVVRLSQGQSVLFQAGDARGVPPSDAGVVAVRTNGVSWDVRAWSTAGSAFWPWMLLVGGLVVAAIVAGLALLSERASRAAAAEAEARAHELALVARIGPMLQQSLDLGDVLPAFVLEVSDELGLEGVSVSLANDDGGLDRAFSLGVEAASNPTEAAALRPPPASVAPDELVVIPLRRSSRVVGALSGRARLGLQPPQMETLVAVCNLLAAAVGNVRLFRDEQEMVASLRGLDRMKTSFIGTVSHELRTTVTAIDGFARLLEADDGSLPEAQRTDYIERIKRNAGSLSRLVEDLLDFARFERSSIPIALQPVDLSDLVPKLVDQVTSILSEHPVEAEIEPGVTAIADPIAIERILGNLLSNAGKYSPPGAAIEVRLRRHGRDAVIAVIDHGDGIADVERERIFELFYRVDSAAARATRGVGIGLAIARQLTTRMHGTIDVEETPGGGATFVVTIPVAADAADAADAAGNDDLPSESLSPSVRSS